MVTIEQIFGLIGDECAVKTKQLTPCTDLFDELGIEGDEFSELIEKYALSFNVNMDGYLWYFHSNDEGINFWSFIFKPPNKKVNRIAVTPELLLHFANTKIWDVNYPTHDKPTNRADIVYSNLVWLIVLLGIYLVSIW